jgi:hypothetical protein
MTKPSRSYYSAAVEHKEVPGCFMASFATPGEAPMWVTGSDGKPKIFISQDGAELAGFRVMVSRLNRARNVQQFETKGYTRTGGIKVFRAEEPKQTHTIESVFGKKNA